MFTINRPCEDNLTGTLIYSITMQAYADICNRPPSVYGLYLPYIYARIVKYESLYEVGIDYHYLTYLGKEAISSKAG